MGGSWHSAYRSKDGYVCSGLSVKQLSSIRAEDLPEGLVLEAVAPLQFFSMWATIRVERGLINVCVGMHWTRWPYAVGREELEERLTHMLRGLGYNLKPYDGHGCVEVSLSCSGKLSPYMEDLLEGLEGFRSWVFKLHDSRVEEARRMLKRVSEVDGSYLAARGNLSGIARLLVASLTRDDIAYLIRESDGVNSHVKRIVFRELRLDERYVYDRLRILGLCRRVGESMQAVWPFPIISVLVKNLYSSWSGDDAVVSQYLNAHYLMAYIYRNLYPLIVRDSRYGSDVRWRHGLKKFLEERLYPILTFIDITVTASLCLGIQPPLHRLQESLKTLKNLGILSENLKPRPYAVNITRLVRGYMAKTGLVKNPEREESGRTC